MNHIGQKRIVVLISGSGSNLQAIIDACESGQINGKVVAVLSNKPLVKGLERAKKHNIPAITLKHGDYSSRESFDNALANSLVGFNADLIVLAGFMRILSPDFVNQFQGKMLNIHPSLLPKYPGLHTHQRALDNGDLIHGASIHFVTAELDGGPIVIQAQVNVESNDSVDTLAHKVAQKEWIIYPMVVSWFCDERLTLLGDQVYFDKTIIKTQGISYESLDSNAKPII